MIAQGRSAERENDFAGARAAYAKAAVAGDRLAYFYLGRLHRSQDNFAAAVEAYSEALDADDGRVVAWSALELGVMMERRRRFEAAADYYRRATAAGDADAGARASRHLRDLELSRRVRPT